MVLGVVLETVGAGAVVAIVVIAVVVVVGASLSAKLLCVAWCGAVFADGRGVVHKVLIAKFIALSAPVYSAVLVRHVPFVLDPQTEIPVITMACLKLIPVDVLHHDRKVFKKLKIIFRVEMKMGLSKYAPGRGPAVKCVGFDLLEFVVLES